MNSIRVDDMTAELAIIATSNDSFNTFHEKIITLLLQLTPPIMLDTSKLTG